MFQKRISYILVKKDEDGKVVDAVGSFFRGELKYEKINFEMEDAVPMEEMAFRKKYPKLYNKIFRKYWHMFIETFLKTLDWIDFEEEVTYDEKDGCFRSSWFTLSQNPDDEEEIIVDHSIFSNQINVRRLINDLHEYLKDAISLHINPVVYLSIIEKNKAYWGTQAAQRMFAETMMVNTILN